MHEKLFAFEAFKYFNSSIFFKGQKSENIYPKFVYLFNFINDI